MRKDIRKKLVSMSETEYRKFTSNLIPGCENILGVRQPVLKQYAKELIKSCDDFRILLMEEDMYYEETILRAYLIGLGTKKEKNFELAKQDLLNFIPRVNNWAVNDCFCAAFDVMDNFRGEFIKILEKLVKSKKEYEARIGLIMLLDHYLKVDCNGKKINRKRSVSVEDLYANEEKGMYIERIIELVNRDFKENGYYTCMAAGWLLAEAFVVFPKTIYEFLKDEKNNKMDEESCKKAIRKICESKNPSDEVKVLVKELYDLKKKM